MPPSSGDVSVKSRLQRRSRELPPEIKARTLDERGKIPAPITNLLSRNQQARVRSISTMLEYQRGSITIFSEGEDAHFVYCVNAGVVRISRYAEGGRRQVFAFMMPGDLFGLPDSGIYLNSAITVCPSTVYRIPWRQLRALLLKEPELQLNMLVKVAFDFRQAQRQILMLGQQNITQRLASLLMDFIQHPEFYDPEKRILSFPISRPDVGDYLGSAPETVARAFARLESLGLINRISSRLIEIGNPHALRGVLTGRRRS
jgi:CRP-like cAMP-binding protein